MAFENGEEFPDVFEEFSFIVKEGFNVKESSEFGEANLIGPGDFFINGVDIKTIPHLNFVDSICRDVVDTG